jgi:hypothetical protein
MGLLELARVYPGLPLLHMSRLPCQAGKSKVRLRRAIGCVILDLSSSIFDVVTGTLAPTRKNDSLLPPPSSVNVLLSVDEATILPYTQPLTRCHPRLPSLRRRHTPGSAAHLPLRASLQDHRLQRQLLPPNGHNLPMRSSTPRHQPLIGRERYPSADRKVEMEEVRSRITHLTDRLSRRIAFPCMA